MKQILLFYTDRILLFALLLLMGAQLYSVYSSHEKKFENPVQFVKKNYKQDYITQYASRFEGIRKELPTTTTLSYVGEANESFSMHYFNYVMTQYYLSPNLIFKNNVNHDTIIYNLYSTKQIDANTNFHLNNGWHILKDFNNGLILLSK